MRRWMLLIVVATPLLFGQMCGAPEPAPKPDCLELEDVINIPAGTGTGPAFSGTYKALSAVVELCDECAANNVPDTYCSAPVVEQMILTVVQNNGVLTVDHPDIRMTGRIDQGGSFEVGGVGAPTRDDGVRTGQVLMIFRGQFTGDLMVGDLQLRITAQSQQGDTLDLGQSVAITARRQAVQ